MRIPNLFVHLAGSIIGIILSSMGILYGIIFSYHLVWLLCSIFCGYLCYASIRKVYSELQKIDHYLLGILNKDSSMKIDDQKGSPVSRDIATKINQIVQLYKENKQEILHKELYYSAIIDKSNTGLFSYGEDDRVIDCNPKAKQLLGLENLHHIQSLNKINTSIPTFLKDQIKSNKQQKHLFEGDNSKLLFNTSELIIDGKRISIVAVHDITLELNRNETEAWIKLSRTLSHEIMNAMTPMISLSNVILGYFKQGDQNATIDTIGQQQIDNAVKALNIIEDQAKGLVQFVNNYRQFTILPEPEPIAFNIKEQFDSQLLLYKEMPHADKVDIICNIPEESALFCDAKLLHHVMMNIIKNALESFNFAVQKYPKIIIESHQRYNRTHITITNNGMPIDRETEKQIFTPFYTTKESGSGIGLSLSKQLVIKMGGNLTLNTNTTNTEFIIQLPS
ncbi:PAS domain-containing sensor histidine kinase [Halosquirtibacter xylanolyticus]|uniref:sensor histidine kinase n=1 Tax=Halosquirtibacter xylanolyticus TaxID=3374599 RepID=UPI0037496C57|nr:PAS domain-containing sensor histidine kinase [Prolixibacteraceae bacterium]